MKFQEFYQMMVDALGQTETTTVPVLPFEQMKGSYEEIDRHAEENGVEHGILYSLSGQVQEEDLFVDPADTWEELGIKDGDTTDDGLFSLKVVACLGCCSLSPVMMINDETYGSLTPQKTKKIIRR